MDRQFGTTSEFVILGSSVVSTSVTSSDLLNTTLVSPGNAVKAHRQPIQIPLGSPRQITSSETALRALRRTV